MEEFIELNQDEKLKTTGGVFVIDDAILWGLIGTGFAAGIKVGVNKKNRIVKENKR